MVNVVFYTVGWWDLLYSDTSRCSGHVVSNMCSKLDMWMVRSGSDETGHTVDVVIVQDILDM